MQCTILKSFTFSRDGIRSERAAEGHTVDIPDGLVDGLEAEHYLRRGAPVEAKAISGAPENKMVPAAQENKAPDDEPAGDVPANIADVRAEYEQVMGKRAFHGWDADELRRRMADA